MKALFLAGGIGSRLKAMTKNLPKPMIPVMGKPLLARNIARLKKFGIDEIILSTCYLPEKIREYFGDGHRFGMQIVYVHEQKALGTAGAIRNAAKYFHETFLAFNGDIVSDIHLDRMVAMHREKKAAVTIAATRVENPSAYGVIEYDEANYIRAFKEKPQPGETDSHLINAGIYLFEPEVLQEIPTNRNVSVEKETYPRLLSKGYRLAVYDEKAYWRDLGTPRDYLAFHQDIFEQRHRLPPEDRSANVYGICPGAKIDARASLIEPVYIARDVQVGAHCVIGPYASLEKGTVVDHGAELDHCVVWPGAHIGPNAAVSDAIVLGDSTIQAGSHCRHEIVAGTVPPVCEAG